MQSVGLISSFQKQKTTVTDLDTARQRWKQGKYDEAFDLYHPWAEKGNAEAQAHVASMYKRGNGVEVDIVESLYWYAQAIKHGDSKWSKRALKGLEAAQIYATDIPLDESGQISIDTILDLRDIYTEISNIYREGIDIDIDGDRADKWNARADALTKVEFLLKDTKQEEESLERLLIAADGFYESGEFIAAYIIYRRLGAQDEACSILKMARMFQRGEGVKEDVEIVEKLLKHVMHLVLGHPESTLEKFAAQAIDIGFPECLEYLFTYWFGKGIDQDYYMAEKCAQLALGYGNSELLHRLAQEGNVSSDGYDQLETLDKMQESISTNQK